MWALVNPIGFKEKRFIETVFTGERLYDVDNMKYLGTYQLNSDSMVFHVFEHVILKPK